VITLNFERDLVTIVIIVLAVALLAAIVYTIINLTKPLQDEGTRASSPQYRAGTQSGGQSQTPKPGQPGYNPKADKKNKPESQKEGKSGAKATKPDAKVKPGAKPGDKSTQVDEQGQKVTDPQYMRDEKKVDTTDDYRRVIDSSKTEYQLFMDTRKSGQFKEIR
jgi:cytoskeletal protein RodZ